MKRIASPSIHYFEFFQRLDSFLKDKLSLLLQFTTLLYAQIINTYFVFYVLTIPMREYSTHFNNHGFQHSASL